MEHRLHAAAPGEEAFRAAVLIAELQPGTLRRQQGFEVARLVVLQDLLVQGLHSGGGQRPLPIELRIGRFEVAQGAHVHVALRHRLVAVDRFRLRRQDQCGQQRDHAPQVPARIGSAERSGVMPRRASSASSASSPALGAVSSLSPVKIELAPAMKHSAWVASLIASRPADRRTIDSGMVIRAVATVRTNSISSIRASGVSASMSPRTVPLTGTSALIGTLSGWRGRVARAWMKPTRSSRVSPIPTMPPEQTEMPAARTF